MDALKKKMQKLLEEYFKHLKDFGAPAYFLQVYVEGFEEHRCLATAKDVLEYDGGQPYWYYQDQIKCKKKYPADIEWKYLSQVKTSNNLEMDLSTASLLDPATDPCRTLAQKILDTEHVRGFINKGLRGIRIDIAYVPGDLDKKLPACVYFNEMAGLPDATDFTHIHQRQITRLVAVDLVKKMSQKIQQNKVRRLEAQLMRVASSVRLCC